jgi:hypothetical protein
MNQHEKSDLKKVLYHIESDPKTGHVGIAEKIISIDERVTAIELGQTKIQERNKVLYKVGVTVVGVGTFVIGKSWSAIVAFLRIAS